MSATIFPVDIHTTNGITIMRFEVPHIEHDNIDTMRHLILSYVDTHLPSRVVINMRKIEYMHSLGIGLLVAALKHIQAIGGKLKLCSLQTEVHELLTVTHMHTLFDCYDNEPSALASFEELA